MQRIRFEDLELGPLLGTGTVGSVYRARVKSTDDQVAVKILQDAISNDELVRKRFRREMEILERLHHPHIIHYFGGGEHDGRLYYAMEILDGGNVRDLLERYGHLSWQETASIGRQVCSALQAAHNNGIIHRDLKPSNLFLDSDANIKLGDFGIARDTRAADITSQGLTVGTHAYMPPEQIKGERIVDGKADLYSLGCLLFELLTGVKPFEGTNFAVLFEQHLHKRPPRVTEYVPDCPASFADIIEKLLAKDPDDRPFNARAVQGVFNELLASHGISSKGKPADASSSKPDVGAATVVDVDLTDPGLSSLRRKLHPDARPELSWKVLVVIAGLVAAIVAIALFSSQG